MIPFPYLSYVLLQTQCSFYEPPTNMASYTNQNGRTTASTWNSHYETFLVSRSFLSYPPAHIASELPSHNKRF